jgi:hypothetical protein
MLITPRSAEYWRLFDGFRHTAFRLETLQTYEDEPEPLRCFLAGEPRPPMPGKERWVARISAARASGKAMSRAHLVREPLTDYMLYELQWSYPPNVEAGEDVWIVPEPARLPARDFWLFDSRDLLWLNYDADGRMTGAELEDDPAEVVRANYIRDAALHAGISFTDYAREIYSAA